MRLSCSRPGGDERLDEALRPGFGGLACRRGRLMEKAILLAVAARVCTATASGCQRAGARNTSPAAGFDARVIVRLARQPARLLGIPAMIRRGRVPPTAPPVCVHAPAPAHLDRPR